ncbi:amino acid ABC transporter permease [Bifidobacterium cebidarum]|uniref:Cysteine ABC transporter permease n=1 Tax=Bifidobacterium cebidarum TaxID=2650773 RepID=A0A6I1GAG5_9BIFI|nr:amino acid ABC transporter permease [Bifidobacterium cebidarum]KAB7786539.1 cysteine ABC transporter permease [Bifidobacterium cebidarum]
MGDYFTWNGFIHFIPKIAAQLPMTLLIVGGSLAIGVLLGLLLAFVRVFSIPVAKQIAIVFTSFVRGTPEIVQVFIVYYGLPLLVQSITGVDIDALSALYFVIVAFGINTAGYLAELFRGALESVPRGQYEAGEAAGLTRGAIFRRIVIPQAAKFALPGFGVNVVYLFQSTSMAAAVGVMDMMGKAANLGSATGRLLQSYAAAAVLFIIISIVLQWAFTLLDKRVTFGR